MFDRVAIRNQIGLFVCIALAASSAQAQESNRESVRRSLEADSWRVIWGKTFTEADWVTGTGAIATSVASNNPKPFLAWFSSSMEENFRKIQSNMADVTRRDLERWILQSLESKRIITYNGLQIEAGFASYNRWYRTVHHEPRLRTRGIHSKIEMVKVENRIPLPNWHQFYIRYRLAPGNRGGGEEERVSSDNTYTLILRNADKDSIGVEIHYKHVSGDWKVLSGTLQPGETVSLDDELPTRNRWIFIRGESLSDGSVWDGDPGDPTEVISGRRFRRVDLGDRIGRMTYTFR